MFIEPFNFSLFCITGWDIDLDYCDIEWLDLEMNRVRLVVFELAPKNCISDSSVNLENIVVQETKGLAN